MVEQLIGERPEAFGDLIKDTTTADFVTDVIEASNTIPILVDFWAPWCEPCKQLTPLLEKIVTDAAGKIKLVKLNIEEHPQLAQQLQIQSIPAVYAFQDGRPVDAFVGVQSPSQIKQFVERLAGNIGPSPVEEALDIAEAEIRNENYAIASNLYEQVMQADPLNVRALAGLARCNVALNSLDEARNLLRQVPDQHSDHEMVSAAKSALSLAEMASELGELDSLQEKAESDTADNQSRLNYSIALIAQNQHERAIEQLLGIVAIDKKWNDGAAQEQLLKIFEILGPKHELTEMGRRRLSSVLFS